MSEEPTEHEELEEEQAHGYMTYEDMMKSNKITIDEIKEHMTGPVISTVVHIILLAFLGSVVVFEAPKESKAIEVEMKKLEPTKIKPPPPPPPPPEQEQVDDPVNDVPVQTPDVKVDVDVKVDNISVDTPAEVEMPSALNMTISNSALKLQVPVGGGRKGGKSIGFGYGSKAEGDLVGIMYDLKTDPSGNIRKGFDYRGAPYWDDVKKFIDNGLKYEKKLGFRRMKKKLFLSDLYIPKMRASQGPKEFGVEKEMKPSGFFIHYSGEITPKKRFRFAGQGDDLLIVFIDQKPVLDASWTHFMFKDPKLRQQQARCFTGQPLEIGKWIEPGRHRIDILFGERPGGLISAVLLIQQDGKKYPRSGNHLLLPIFTTTRLPEEEKARIGKSSWKIATDGPAMYARRLKVKKEKEVTGLEIEE